MHICLSINLNLEENHAKRCMELGEKVDSYLSTWREHREHEHHNDIAFKEYHKES